jgi:hypothetical protein
MTRATARTDVRVAAPARTPVHSAARSAARSPVRPAPNRTTDPRPDPRPELRLVPAAAPAAGRRVRRGLRNRRAPFVLLVVAMLAATTLGLLILNTAIAVDSLKATQLRTENAQRAQEVQRLERQVVDGRSPAAVAEAAVEAGLIPAGPAGYLVIGPDGSVLRGTPEPAGTDVDEDEDGN